MRRPRSNSPPKKTTATAPTSSPCTSPRKSDKATEQSKAGGGDTTTKAAATVPTPPRVTRSQNKSGATGNVTNTKDGDNLTDAKNDGENKISDAENPTGAENNLGDDNNFQLDGANEGNDKQEEEPKRKTTKEPKSKATSAAKTIHNETEPEIDGSEKSGDESSLSSNASRKTKAFNAGKLYIILSCSYFDSNKCSFFADEMRKFPKELVEKVRLHL